jgi:extradiol dioxygenase
MNIAALGYLGFESPNAQAWASFGPEVFGFGLAEPGADGSVYLRMDSRHHRIAIHPGGTDRIAYIGWELRDSDAFLAAVEELRATGLTPELGNKEECRIRRVQAFARFRDPADYVHEVFFGASFTPGSFLPGRAMKGFVAGTQGVGHVVVVVPETTKELDTFATQILGLTPFAGAPSEFVERGGPSARFYRCNRRTHCLAYVGVPGQRGMQHFCIEAHSIDDVGLAYDIAEQRQLPITLTLGRHQMDTLVSFYMRTPSGFDMEFGAGGALLDDSFTQVDPSSPELWGHKQLIRGWAPTIQAVAR